MNWRQTKVLVTGGASFIGSHLVDALVERGAAVRVVDNLSSGRLENIQHHIDAGAVEFQKGDLLDQAVAEGAVRNMNLVFHLAADHGGRGYVDLHQVGLRDQPPARRPRVPGLPRKPGVEKVVYASSGCVYPNHLQTDPARCCT